ncbi:MAG: PAS domain S-box protein [Bacteroidota bacterium]
MTPNILLQKQLKKLGKILIYIVLTISLLILIGHLFSPVLLKLISFGGNPMVSVATIAYIVTSSAFLLAVSENKNQFTSILLKVFCFGLILLGGIIVLSIFTEVTIPFLTAIINKNSILVQKLKIPPVATCFTFYGLAILNLNYETKNKKKYLSQYLIIPPLLLGVYLFLAYLYSSSILIKGAVDIPLSIYSSFFNIIIPIAIFFVHPEKGLAGEITKTKTGSNTLLNLLPGIILLPILMGIVHLNYFPTSLGLAVIILIFIVFGVSVLYYNLRIINKDLQERLLVQSELKVSLKDVSYLTELIERTTDAIFVVDKEYCIIKWNKGAENIYGYTREEVTGKNKYELLDAPYMSWEEFMEGVQILHKQNGERTSKRYQQTKSGKRISILQSTVTLKDEYSNVDGYIIVAKDVTQLEEKEDKLALLNNELNKLVNAKTIELNSVYERISDAVIVLDKNWRYTYHNNMAYLVTKETARIDKSLVGKNIWEEFPFIVNTSLSAAYHKALEEQTTIRLEYYYKEFDMWTEQTIYPTPEGISVFLRDITEQKLAEIKQKDAEEKYRTIVESSQEGIIIRDTNGIITFVNDYLTKMLKESREYLIGLPLINLFSDENFRIMKNNMERRNQGFSDTYDLTLPLRDGSFITVYIKSTPYHEKGVFAGSLSTVTDITDNKK